MSNLTNAAFITTCIQSFLYGIYFTTCLHCVRWLAFSDEGWSPRRDIRWAMLWVTLSIFVLTTTDLALTLMLTVTAVKSGTIIAYANVVILTIERLTSVITDYVLMYRCWIIYSRSRRVMIVPVLLWLATVACLIAGTSWATMEIRTNNLQFTHINNISMAFFACTIVLNIYTTSAIILRIWLVARNSIGSGRQFHFAIRVVVESGLLYTTTSIMLLCALAVGRTSGYSMTTFPRVLLSAINFSMTGIAFNLLLMRTSHYRVHREVDVISLPEVRFAEVTVDSNRTTSRGEFDNFTATPSTTNAVEDQHHHESGCRWEKVIR
ncbi:hypothetical protein AMATHDRAFT_62301 [Amanita thiersii Skay4041]|uniref:Transmembrane protein n=1 Tax=Amanita thiersii Skay4041 TaxID=703135 RepID=A0A2A9NQD0_9AGAR|nr:hypothetical protein AMATHDRAFT_62301 [Amanita thiersii Skay4041]